MCLMAIPRWFGKAGREEEAKVGDIVCGVVLSCSIVWECVPDKLVSGAAVYCKIWDSH